MGNVMEGVAHKKAILDEYNALMADYNDENAEKAGKLQDVIVFFSCRFIRNLARRHPRPRVTKRFNL